MKNKKYAILINSCDKYSDIWPIFFKLFFKYWNVEGVNVYLNTEELSHPDSRVITLNNKSNIPYGERFLNCLKQIEEDYIINILDDFFIRSYVDNNEIEKIVQSFDYNKKIAAVYFEHEDKFHQNWYKNNGALGEKFKQIKFYAPYRINLQLAVWRKKDLMDSMKGFYNPWEYEAYGTRIRMFDGRLYFILKTNQESPINYRLNYDIFAIVQGKWYKKDVIPLFQKENINVDFEKRGFYNKNEKKNSSQSIFITFENYWKFFKKGFKYYRTKDRLK